MKIFIAATYKGFIGDYPLTTKANVEYIIYPEKYENSRDSHRIQQEK